MPRMVLAKWWRVPYQTTKVDKLIPQMPYVIPDKPIKVRGNRSAEHLRRLYPEQMRLKEISKSVTSFIDQERIELPYYRGYETRNYTERLIAEAIRYGDCHKPTMELANFYLTDKTLVHKLFKVLVPRYLNYTSAFTSMYLLPAGKIDWTNPHARKYVGQRILLELKGHPYPKLFSDKLNSANFLHNILLSEASKEYYKEKSQRELNEQTTSKDDQQ